MDGEWPPRSRRRSSRSSPSSNASRRTHSSPASTTGRRGRHDPVRRGRHRRPGLHGAAPPHVPPLGRTAASRPKCSKPAPARKPASSRRPSRSRARTPTASSRPSEASTASSDCRRSTRRIAGTPRSRRSSRARSSRRRRDRDRRRRHPRRHLPRERRRRPAREQDRLRGPPHAHPVGHRRQRPERALPVVEQGDRAQDSPLTPRRASRGGAGRRARQGARGREHGLRRKCDSQLCPAPVSTRKGSPHRATRSETSRECSTGTSMVSSTPTCLRRRRDVSFRDSRYFR